MAARPPAEKMLEDCHNGARLRRCKNRECQRPVGRPRRSKGDDLPTRRPERHLAKITPRRLPHRTGRPPARGHPTLSEPIQPSPCSCRAARGQGVAGIHARQGSRRRCEPPCSGHSRRNHRKFHLQLSGPGPLSGRAISFRRRRSCRAAVGPGPSTAAARPCAAEAASTGSDP